MHKVGCLTLQWSSVFAGQGSDRPPQITTFPGHSISSTVPYMQGFKEEDK